MRKLLFALIASYFICHVQATTVTAEAQALPSSFVCSSGVCDSCKIDADCMKNHHCVWNSSSSVTTPRSASGFCEPYEFFERMSWRQIVISVIFVATAFLASGAGSTGLGAINIPILLLIMSLSTTEAVPPVQAAIAGASLSAILMYARRTHPAQSQRALIDVDAMLVLLPPLLVGIAVGALLRNACPQWLVLTLLAVLVTWGSWKSIHKSVSMWNKETEAKQANSAQERSSLLSDGDEDEVDDNIVGFHQSSNRQHRSSSIPIQSSASSSKSMREQHFGAKLTALTSFFVIMAVVELLRGGDVTRKSIIGIKFCSVTFWSIFGAEVFVLLAGGVTAGVYLIRRYRFDAQSGRIQSEVDIEWTAWRVFVCQSLALCAGIFASSFGTGVGELLTPIMLDMSMAPEAVAATSALVHLLSALAALLDYGVAGSLLWQYCVVFFACSALGQVVGLSVIDWMVRKYRRPSIVAVIMATMVTLASLLMMVMVGFRVEHDVRLKQHLKWNPVCPAS